MKKIILFVTTMVLVFALFGCSSGNTTQDKDGSVKNDTDSEDVISSEKSDDADMTEIPDDIVTDAVNYSREIISVIGADYSGYNHTIRIPQINLSSKNAQSFNKKIYDNNAEPYEKLLNYTENQMIYNMDYTYKVYTNLIGIISNFQKDRREAADLYYIRATIMT